MIEPVVLAEALARRALALGDVLLLPPRRARVLTVALEDPDGTLATLQARVSGALAAAGRLHAREASVPSARDRRPAAPAHASTA